MFAISRIAGPVIAPRVPHRVFATATQVKTATIPTPLKHTGSPIQQPPIQTILITNKYACAMPQEYRGTGQLFMHGSTAEDLANIRDKGIAGRLYVMPLSSYPPTTEIDHQSLSDAIGYAVYAAQKKATPAVGVFELMQHKTIPGPASICLDDQRGTLYFQTTQGQAALRLITVIDHKKHPLELPKEGQRTRREGSSALRMSLGWYGPMFVGVCVLDHLIDVISAM